MKTFPAALRLNTPVATLAGADDSLEAINTTELPNGALCTVLENNAIYFLRKNSVVAASSPLIIAPAQGGTGRWYLYESVIDFQNVALVVPDIGANSAANITGLVGTGIIDDNDIVVYNMQSSGYPTGLILGTPHITGADTWSMHVNNVSGATITGDTYALRVAILPSL